METNENARLAVTSAFIQMRRRCTMDAERLKALNILADASNGLLVQLQEDETDMTPVKWLIENTEEAAETIMGTKNTQHVTSEGGDLMSRIVGNDCVFVFMVTPIAGIYTGPGEYMNITENYKMTDVKVSPFSVDVVKLDEADFFPHDEDNLPN